MSKKLNVRIDEALDAEIEKFIAGTDLTKQSVANSALRQFLINASRSSSKAVSGYTTTESAQREGAPPVAMAIKSAEQSIPVTKEEWRWVDRVLRIVRGGRQEALLPLDTNLDAFVLMTEILQGWSASGPSEPEAEFQAEPAEGIQDLLANQDRVADEEIQRRKAVGPITGGRAKGKRVGGGPVRSAGGHGEK